MCIAIMNKQWAFSSSLKYSSFYVTQSCTSRTLQTWQNNLTLAFSFLPSQFSIQCSSASPQVIVPMIYVLGPAFFTALVGFPWRRHRYPCSVKVKGCAESWGERWRSPDYMLVIPVRRNDDAEPGIGELHFEVLHDVGCSNS